MTVLLARTECPLYDIPYYNYNVILDEDSFNLKFLFNSVMQLYTMSVADAAGNILVSGIGLTPYHPILMDYDVEGISGYFQMLPVAENVAEEYYKLYPEKLSKYYKLYYFTENI